MERAQLLEEQVGVGGERGDVKGGVEGGSGGAGETIEERAGSQCLVWLQALAVEGSHTHVHTQHRRKVHMETEAMHVPPLRETL